MKLRTLLSLTVTTSILLVGGTIAQAANPDHVQRLLKTNQCPNCDLSSADLQNANLFGANLVNANLKNANLNGANLGSANFTDANLSGAKVTNAYLYLATLDGTTLSQADFSNSYLRDVIFSNTNLNGVILHKANLSRTNLSGVNFQGADLSEADLHRSTLTGIIPGAFGRNAAMTGTPLGEDYFRQTLCDAGRNGSTPPPAEELARFGMALANLNGAILKGANLSETVLVAGDLRGADLSQANLTRSCLGYARLNNAILDGAELKDARLEKAVLEGTSLKDVKNASLDGTYTSEAALQAGPAQQEAKQYVGSMNRTQQAYYLEFDRFSRTLNELGLGFKPDTENYLYRVFVQGKGDRVVTAGIARKDGLNSYIGLVTLGRAIGTGERTTIAYLCESQQPTKLLPPKETLTRLSQQSPCPSGYKKL